MKKLIFSILLLSSPVFAEDIYDRINECEQRSDRDCLIALIRELAQERHRSAPPAEATPPEKKVESSDAVYEKGLGCEITWEKSRSADFWNMRVSNGSADTLIIDVSDLGLKTAQDLTKAWEYLYCDSRAKVNCQLHGNSQIGLISNTLITKPKRDAPETFKELQNSICR
jgi:hypothetical protein